MSDRAALIISCSRQQAATIHQRAELERRTVRSEEHTSELQSRLHLVCRLLLEKKEEFMASRRANVESPRALTARIWKVSPASADQFTLFRQCPILSARNRL